MAIDIPADLATGLLTNRAELIRQAKPRAMTIAECEKLYQLIGSLLETNMILRQHAAETANLVSHWTEAFKHLESLGRRIEHYAHFRRDDG